MDRFEWTEADDIRAERVVAAAQACCDDDAHAATILCTASFGMLAEHVGPQEALRTFNKITEQAAQRFAN